MSLRDQDGKGYLDTDDFEQVVQVCRELERHGRPASRMVSNLESEMVSMDLREMIRYIASEAASLDDTNMDESIRAIVSKYSDAIKQLRADELFVSWDSKRTG